MTKKEIKEELKSILKDYHYNSDSEQMSKDVVTALENLIVLKTLEPLTPRTLVVVLRSWHFGPWHHW